MDVGSYDPSVVEWQIDYFFIFDKVSGGRIINIVILMSVAPIFFYNLWIFCVYFLSMKIKRPG